MNGHHGFTSLVCLLVAVGVGTAEAQNKINRKHTETLLAPFPPEVHDSAQISPDSRRLAYVVQSGRSEMVVVDGREERAFGRIGGGTLVFSPNSRRLGYVANVGQVTFAVIDNVRQRRYDLVGYLTFTPDSRFPVYVAAEGNKAFTVVDDKEALHSYEAVWNVRGQSLLFDTRKTFHYLALKDGNLYLVEEE